MNFALAIVERAKARVSKGGKLLPRTISKKNRTSEDLEQEQRDASKLNNLKYALIGTTHAKCSDVVRDYFDEHLPGWRHKDTEDKTKKSMKLKETAEAIIESPDQKRQRVHSELSQLHQKYKTLTSEHLRQAFEEDPSLWHKYHDISEENETSFPEQEIPRNRIIQELCKLKSKRTKIVVDMGCGKAHIARHFRDTRFKFINLDHVACDETVTSCDISNTKLEEDSVEICILSLAMWGSNCASYVREAYRILESNGILYMIEPTKRWTDVETADKLIVLLEESGFRIVEKNIAKFSLFICTK